MVGTMGAFVPSQGKVQSMKRSLIVCVLGIEILTVLAGCNLGTRFGCQKGFIQTDVIIHEPHQWGIIPLPICKEPAAPCIEADPWDAHSATPFLPREVPQQEPPTPTLVPRVSTEETEVPFRQPLIVPEPKVA